MRAADAPIVVIQEVENSAGRRVDVDVEVYSNFNSAFKALILTQNDEFKGQIAAVLNDRGTAEYVVMNNALNDNIIVNDPNVGNTGDFTINSLAFTNARMEIEITNDTGVDFTSTDIHVVVRNADGNPVYSGYATGAPGGSVDDGETEKVYFGGYTAVPSTSGNYTVTMTVKVGNVTYTATNVIGTI